MAKKSSLTIGIVALILGILGFISNPLVGADGLFQTGTVLNIIYIIFGLILIYTGTKAASSAPMAMKVIGVIYLIVAILGLIGGDSVIGLFAVNGADNWLHLILGLVLVWLGWKKAGGMSAPMSGNMPGQM